MPYKQPLFPPSLTPMSEGIQEAPDIMGVAASLFKRVVRACGLLAIVARVIIRRYVLMHGPKLPSWSLKFEIVVEVMRSLMRGNASAVDKDVLKTLPAEKIERIKLDDRVKVARGAAGLRKVLAQYDPVLPAWARCTSIVFTLQNSTPFQMISSNMPTCDRTGTRQVTADVITCDAVVKSGSSRVILYLHGGAYMFCSSKSHAILCARLSKASDATVIALNYRMAPEHMFPSALNDVCGVYAWLIGLSSEHSCHEESNARPFTRLKGITPQNITIMGDSAGGNLSLVSTLLMRDLNMPLPSGVAPLSPWADLTSSNPTWQQMEEYDYLPFDPLQSIPLIYAGSHKLSEPLLSPVNADFHDFPPLLIQAGAVETLVGECRALYKKAHADGVNVTFEEYPDMVHVFHMLPHPLARSAVKRLGQFARRWSVDYIPAAVELPAEDVAESTSKEEEEARVAISAL